MIKYKLGNTLNGVVYKCNGCDKVHVEFKNFIFHLSDIEYETFADSVIELNYKISLNKNHLGRFYKNITIPTESNRLKIVLNSEELEELASLFSRKFIDNFNFIEPINMSYNYSLS